MLFGLYPYIQTTSSKYYKINISIVFHDFTLSRLLSNRPNVGMPPFYTVGPSGDPVCTPDSKNQIVIKSVLTNFI